MNWSPEEDSKHPTRAWMEQIWDYIDHNQPRAKDWPLLGKVQLLPINNGTQLCRFSVGERIILRQKGNHELPSSVCSFLCKVGMIVLFDMPEFVSRNMQLVHHFVHEPSCEGLVDALMALNQQISQRKLIEKIKLIWLDDSVFLNGFVSYISDSGISLLPKKKKAFMRGMPLFTTVEGFKVSQCVSLYEVDVSAPLLPLPLPFPKIAIDVSNQKVRYVLESLGISRYHTFSLHKLLKDTFIPAIKERKYDIEQIDDLVCYIMDSHEKILNDKDILEVIVGIPFMETGIGQRAYPHNLYNPTSPLLKSVLDDSHFPNKKYHTGDRIAWLTKLGLRATSNVTHDTFLHIANNIANHPERADNLIKLTKLLSQQHPEKQWWTKLQDIPFLSAIQSKPDIYPTSLPWAGNSSQKLLRPDEVCHVKFAKAVGSVLPVVDLDESALVQLNIKAVPSLEDLIGHLKEITVHYNAKEKVRYLFLLDDVYQHMSGFCKRDIKNALSQFEVSSWIWSESGFQTAGRMCLQPLPLDLAPYAISVPPELESHKELMQRVGVPAAVQLNRVMKIIKGKYENPESNYANDVETDLRVSINVLTLLSWEGCTDPLVPTITKDNTNLCLFPASECTLWDGQGEIDDDFHFVHKSVPKEVTDKLCIPSETQRMLTGDEFGIESFGQTEPLTTRLKAILDGYTDGLAILKENVQNADDAGATEVKVIYDMRENGNHRNSLLDPNMASWQGPAIWIYNDAVFKDEDFDNIIKLNGATKMEKQDKIGAFGLGFNAVYNMTDVPIILSQDTLVMFDPHLKYLGRAIDDKSKPGLRINMKRNKKLRRKYPDQFAPWKGVCGCDLQPYSENVTFNGTLFRLPLRGQKESFSSDISHQCYNKENVVELLKLIHDRGSEMLLFTQSVTKVSVALIENKDDIEPLEVIDLFEIRKEPVKYLREHGVKVSISSSTMTKNEETQKFITESSILKVVGENKGQDNIKSSMITASILETTDDYSRFIGSSNKCKSTQMKHWIVTSCIEYSSSVTNEPTAKKAQVAGVAVCLEKQADLYLMKGLDCSDNNPRGSYFSFLPLPVKCPLPFHINGTFILDPSRRNLLQKTEHDKISSGGMWNETLFAGAVCMAYVSMLEDILPLAACDTDITRLLPYNKEDDMISMLSVAFWKKIIQNNMTDLPIFTSPSGLVSLQDAYFLDEAFIKMTEEVQAAVLCVLSNRFLGTPKTLVNLPTHLKDTLKVIDINLLKSRTITEEKFFLDFFLPKQTELPLTQKQKEMLLLNALHLKSLPVANALRSQPSIPVSVDGQQLAYPKHLIHPFGKAAKLYYEEDCRFPYFHSISLTDSSYEKLCELGMVEDDLPWEDILERSTFLTGEDQRGNIDFVNEFLDYLKWKLATKCEDVPRHVRQKIRNEKFLPAAEKPKDWKLKWRGEDSPSFSASEIYQIKEPLLACTQLPILHERICVSRDLMNFLGLKGEDNGFILPMETLRDQVLVLTTETKNMKCSTVRKSLEKVKKHLDQECRDDIKAEKVRRTFSDIPMILVRNELLKANICAFKLTFEAFPYLNEIPRKYERFMMAAGVKELFSCNDYISAVLQMKDDFGDEPLPQSRLWQVVNMLKCALKSNGNQPILDQTCSKMVLIPDIKGVLRPANELCYYDHPLTPTKVKFPLVHETIPSDVAKSFGVEGLQQRALSEMSHAINYEGDDILSDIQSTLEACPSGKDVLLELIKDADASGAKEIHFILDPRTHRNVQVFSDGWRHLQGPSLCVHHNGKITDLNMKQMLGLETENNTKRQNQNLGFQSVYHFTETPTLLATLDDGTKVLCAVDPTGRYVPGTSAQAPAVMYKDVDALRQPFPDVFTCYHENHYKGGNFFRFPLRSLNAAQVSKFRSSANTCKDVDDILQNLSKDGFEALLYLTSVRKIFITRVNGTNGSFETQTIEAELSDASASDIDKFRESLYPQVQMQQPVYYQPVQMMISYKLSISGGSRKETWSVVQQCSTVGDIRDVTVGGVAYMTTTLQDVRLRPERQSNIYCSYLTLQGKTSLPVHIYGNFAINLKEKIPLSVDKKDKWNRSVTENVVAAYLALIIEEKQRVAWPLAQHYYNVFPSLQEASLQEDPFPSDNSSERIMSVDFEHMLIRKLYIALSFEKVILVELKGMKVRWVQPSDICFLKTNFMDINQNVITGAKLCGFEYADCPKKVYSMFETFGPFEMKYFSPSALQNFLKCTETCNWKPLVEKVEQSTKNKLDFRVSTFQPTGMDIVKSMIIFCLQEESFKSNLHQMPLLVTSDGKLRVFNIDNPVYKSADTNLVTPTSDRFLHMEFIDLFEKVESPVFQHFGIKAFCEELAKMLPDKLCQNEPVSWDEANGISLFWLEKVWECIDRMSNEIDSNNDKHKDDDKELLTAGQTSLLLYGGNLCIIPTLVQNERYLFPLNEIHNVFEKEPNSDKLHRLYSMLGTFHSQIRDQGLPLLDLSRNSSVASKMLASCQNPKSMLKALHYHYQKNNSISSMFKDGQVAKYFEMCLQKVLKEKDLIKELPMFETLSGAYTTIDGQCVYVIPSSVPMIDMDSWRRSDMGIIFLKAKAPFKGLYDALNFKHWEEAELYVEYIFPQLELLSHEGHRVHMDYVFHHLQGSQQVMDALSEVECVKNRAGSYCRPCDLYDPTVPVFIVMHDDAELAEEIEERLEVWRKAGMKHIATKEMLVEYAKQIAASRGIAFEYKSFSILQYIQNLKEKTLQVEYLSAVIDIPFIPRKGSSEKDICPDYTQESLVTLRGSVIENQEKLVWTIAPLISRRYANFDKEVLDAAGAISELSCEMVAKNIRRVCEYCRTEPVTSAEKRRRMNTLIDACFRYISQKLDNEELLFEEMERLKDVLVGECCIPVEYGQRFVKPCHTVLEIQSCEEVKPYIFRLPDNLAYSKSVLMLLGLSEVATVRTYQIALGLIYENVGRKPITHETDLDAATLATRQIFNKIKHDKTLNCKEDLWVLTEGHCLCKADEAIFSDSLVLHDRLKSEQNILVDVPLTGSIVATLQCFPPTHQPKLLSATVKEVVAHARSIKTEEPHRLEIHFSSEATVASIERVGHHILRKCAEYNPNNIQQRLREIRQNTVQNIKIRIDEKVKTCLTNEESFVVGHTKERLVFADYASSVLHIAECALDPGPNQFHAYKELADMISFVNGGLFHEQIGLLMVILAEETEKLSSRLDEMGILLFDHST